MSASAQCDEVLDLAASVALDAADPEAERRVEEHLTHCPECGPRVRELREAAGVLGLGVPQITPPPALRERILSLAREIEPERPPAPRALSHLRRVPRVPLAWAAAAAAIAVSLLSLAWAASLQNQISALQTAAAADRERAARFDHVVQVLASDQLAIRRLTPVNQTLASHGVLYLDPETRSGMLMCRHMPPVAPGHVWQLWFVRGTERVSGGLLWPDGEGNGDAVIRVPSDLQSFDSVGLTEEPDNRGRGSDAPTSPRVMGSPLRETSQ